MENKIKLKLIGITYNQIEYGVYALVLQEENGTRRIPIIIGHLEAQAIECKLQEFIPPRPLTHDTMLVSLASFGISLKEVNIKKLPDGVFSADLVLSDGIKELIVDSRASDAISLAIRVNAPIYTTAEVVAETGFEPSESKKNRTAYVTPVQNKEQRQRQINDLSRFTLEQLKDKMNKAVEQEDYEEAARIKIELDKRSGR